MKKIIIPIVVLALACGSIAFWYFAIREESLDVSTQSVNKSKSSESIKEQDSPDGEWTIQEQNDVFVGYEIQELFGGESVKKTAVGKTQSVSGNLTIESGSIISAEIEADMTQLSSDSSRRDRNQETNGLQTNQFNTATFVVNLPTEIGDISKNEEVSIDVKGELTLHGVTNSITAPLKATWDGKVLVVSGELEIVLSDYEIEPPQSPFVQVDETGIIKLQLLFIPST